MIIKVSVDKLIVKPIQNRLVIGGSDNFVYTEFSFDSDWDGLTKTVTFYSGSTAYDVLLTSDACEIPHELLVGGNEIHITVSGYGDKTIRTKKTISGIKVYAEGTHQGTSPGAYTPELWEQVIAVLDTKQDQLIAGQNITLTETEEGTLISARGGGGGADIPETNAVLKGDGAGGVEEAEAGTDYQTPLVAGSGININGNVISATGGGTSDYEDLENLPLINGIELIGDKSLTDLGIIASGIAIEDEDEYYTSDSIEGALSEIGDTLYEHGQDIGYLYRKDVSISPTEQMQRQNIATGDSADTAWGKVQKFFTDLATHAFQTLIPKTALETDVRTSLDNADAAYTALDDKQDTLTAGQNITIVDNVISATGGGGEKAWQLYDTVTIEGDSTTAITFGDANPTSTEPAAVALRAKNAHEILFVLSASVPNAYIKINSASGGARTGTQMASGQICYAKYLGSENLSYPSGKYTTTAFVAVMNVGQYAKFTAGSESDNGTPKTPIDRICFFSFAASDTIPDGTVIKIYLR